MGIPLEKVGFHRGIGRSAGTPCRKGEAPGIAWGFDRQLSEGQSGQPQQRKDSVDLRCLLSVRTRDYEEDDDRHYHGEFEDLDKAQSPSYIFFLIRVLC